MALMKNRVYWEGISIDVENYCKNCQSCNINKGVLKNKQGFMSIFNAKSPFDVVHIDIVGPLPLTRDGNRYVLTIMDRFSRLVKLVPLPSITASIVARAFRTNWILEYGPPGRIITDRGTQFTSTVMKVLSGLFGFKMSFTTAYHPKTNGRLERFHRYMKQRLRIIAFDKELDFNGDDNWDIYIPNIAYSYNITPHTGTKYSPYQIIYNKSPITTIERLLKIGDNNVSDDINNTVGISLQQQIEKLGDEHRQLIEEVRKNQEMASQRIKKQYDKRRKIPDIYNVGQEVYIDIGSGRVGNKRKLGINRKIGVIIDKISDTVYTIRYKQDDKIEPVNIERIFAIDNALRTRRSKKRMRNIVSSDMVPPLEPPNKRIKYN